jgi:hypothetical protein
VLRGLCVQLVEGVCASWLGRLLRGGSAACAIAGEGGMSGIAGLPACLPTSSTLLFTVSFLSAANSPAAAQLLSRHACLL